MDGSVAQSKEERIQEWKKYFESLLNNNDSEKHTDSHLKPVEIELPIASCNFTHTEVGFAISKLRCGKATGMDTRVGRQNFLLNFNL